MCGNISFACDGPYSQCWEDCKKMFANIKTAATTQQQIEGGTAIELPGKQASVECTPRTSQYLFSQRGNCGLSTPPRPRPRPLPPRGRGGAAGGGAGGGYGYILGPQKPRGHKELSASTVRVCCRQHSAESPGDGRDGRPVFPNYQVNHRSCYVDGRGVLVS